MASFGLGTTSLFGGAAAPAPSSGGAFGGLSFGSSGSGSAGFAAPAPAGGGGGDLTVTLNGPPDQKLGLVIDKNSAAPCKISKVTPNGLAVQQKLQPGWAVIAINGQSMESASYEQVMAALKGAGRPLGLTVRRGGGAGAASPAAAGAFGAAAVAVAFGAVAFGAVAFAAAVAVGACGAAEGAVAGVGRRVRRSARAAPVSALCLTSLLRETRRK